MKIGMSPELVQAAYRIADSSTNPISPVMAYLAVMIAFARSMKRTLASVQFGLLCCPTAQPSL